MHLSTQKQVNLFCSTSNLFLSKNEKFCVNIWYFWFAAFLFQMICFLIMRFKIIKKKSFETFVLQWKALYVCESYELSRWDKHVSYCSLVHEHDGKQNQMIMICIVFFFLFFVSYYLWYNRVIWIINSDIILLRTCQISIVQVLG